MESGESHSQAGGGQMHSPNLCLRISFHSLCRSHCPSTSAQEWGRHQDNDDNSGSFFLLSPTHWEFQQLWEQEEGLCSRLVPAYGPKLGGLGGEGTQGDSWDSQCCQWGEAMSGLKTD